MDMLQVIITVQTYRLPCKEGCLCAFPHQSRSEVEAHDHPMGITTLQRKLHKSHHATVSDYILMIDYKFEHCFSFLHIFDFTFALLQSGECLMKLNRCVL